MRRFRIPLRRSLATLLLGFSFLLPLTSCEDEDEELGEEIEEAGEEAGEAVEDAAEEVEDEFE